MIIKKSPPAIDTASILPFPRYFQANSKLCKPHTHIRQNCNAQHDTQISHEENTGIKLIALITMMFLPITTVAVS